MSVQITQNYYFAGSSIKEFNPLATGARVGGENKSSNLKNWTVVNGTSAANKAAADEANSHDLATQNPPKSNLKKYLLIAAWIIGMVAGLTLGIIGIIYKPMLTEIGALMLTAFSGMGAKIIEVIVHKDYQD